MIFETERLIVRKLVREDLSAFHKLQSNPKVMKYADGEIQDVESHAVELDELISKYTLPTNDFWIYAVERKADACFIGTVALVKDMSDDEIGYRFLEEYWGMGFATEVCGGLIAYCKTIGLEKLIGYVIDKNSASVRVLKRYHFKLVADRVLKESQLIELKYELFL